MQPAEENQHQPYNPQVSTCYKQLWPQWLLTALPKVFAFNLVYTAMCVVPFISTRHGKKKSLQVLLTGCVTFRSELYFLLCQIICHTVFRLMLCLCVLHPRLLRGRQEFVFVPRSRQELPANFPEDIPGVCYFLEAAFKVSNPKTKWSQTSLSPRMLDKLNWRKNCCIV